MAENDVQLDLKKRARRRLVGAIALALAAAIILPMVMNSEQRPGSQDLSIRIPSQEEGAPLLSRPLGTAPAPERPRLPAAAEPVPPAPIEADPVLPLPAPEVEVPATVSQAAPVSSRASSASSRASSSHAASSTSSRAGTHAEAERARQILEGTPRSQASSVVASATRYFVQLGLYREEVNARNAVTKASEAGIKAQTERNGDQYRVVVGPFPARAAADDMLAKVRKAGLSGFVASK